MKTLYFDCFAGASGDMILGALVALGVSESELLAEIAKLNFSNYEIKFETVDRAGLSAVKATIKVPHENAHRHLSTIVNIINESGLTENVKRRAIEIFQNLGAAEAKMHNIPIEKVHFHEVGAMDAVIDICAACIGFELLGVEQFACSKIHVGSGTVKMAHGTFPVPPPAVAELLRDVPIYSTEITGELVTPTGAAIIATVCRDYGKIPAMRVQSVGYGAGTRKYKDFPNVLRLMIGAVESQPLDSRFESETQTLVLLETNVDDMSGQIAGFVLERALAAGALDCWLTPIVMKKSRPGVKISILSERADAGKFKDLLFSETTTLGVRVAEIARHALHREIVKVSTEFGEIEIKLARTNGEIVKAAPEFEQCRAAALKANVALREVERAALQAWEKTRNI
jgi:pyridinium-3,5-bisthiocarboxylic acid mononucleotide nickel chelatase